MFAPNFDIDFSSTDADLSLEERADRYVRRVEGFYVHAATYVGVNALLVGINLFTSPDVFWAIWPILGWGVKLAAHAVSVFGLPGRAEWRERTRRSFLRRHGQREGISGRTRARDGVAEEGTDRLERRIQNLETIVTSADWELVVDETPEADSEEKQVAALAREVVHE